MPGLDADRKRSRMSYEQWTFLHTTRSCARIAAEQVWPISLMASTRGQLNSPCDAYAKTEVIPQPTRRLCWGWYFLDGKRKPGALPISFAFWSRRLRCSSFDTDLPHIPASWGSCTVKPSREQAFRRGFDSSILSYFLRLEHSVLRTGTNRPVHRMLDTKDRVCHPGACW